MGLHKIRKGLDLPIGGRPAQQIGPAPAPARVALLAEDYVGMKPTMLVGVGDSVRRGQALFEDKKTPGVRYTAPAGGTVVGINRGDRRALQSVVIRLDTVELGGGDDCVRFEAHTGRHPRELSSGQVRDLLVESGLWTALRARPYGRVPPIDSRPSSVFVTAADSDPLAPDVDAVMAGREADFERGLEALAKAGEGVPVYVCKRHGSAVSARESGPIRIEEFRGPHPSGTAGLHIHLLDPVDRNKLVWHLGYQDTVAIGRLFASGTLPVERVVALAGPGVRNPRLVRTRLGASTSALTRRELVDGPVRVISGSVLAGRRAEGPVLGFLGRYDSQISALAEDNGRKLLGWLAPGFRTFSVMRLFASSFLPVSRYSFSTTTNGSVRAMVPVGAYEKVMPLDILPAPLLRSLLMPNPERAEELGALELIEEDLALCSFVSPEKAEFGQLLRGVLTTLEKEG